MNFINILLVIFGIFGLSFLMLNIGYIFRKREFRGSCSSNNPMLADEFGACPACGRVADEACKMPEVEKVAGKA